MANSSETPKFPKPIPNPLADPKSHLEVNLPLTQTLPLSPILEDEKTDPELVLSGLQPIPSLIESLPINGDTSTNPAFSPASPASPPTPPVVKMPDLGLINPFMKDPLVTEIMVNDMRSVLIEKEGKLQSTQVVYKGIDELNRLTRSILDITGRILSPDQPYVDVMLPDGSRVNIVGPPLTIYGPCITIRKFPSRRMNLNDLIKGEQLDQRMGYFLNACILSRLNILISGGTGSGKTTLLSALASLIPKQERIITIEDTPELFIESFNSVRLQTKLQTPTSNAITARDLVANSLRMRPDRIIVGECRRSEAFDMLQAMNTGHLGSMTTLHANSPRDALFRLETLCMMAGADIPLNAIRKQTVSALDLIIQVKRFRDGKRRVTAITEVTGMEGEIITLQDLFLFESDLDGTDSGTFKSTGFVPSFIPRFRESGIELPKSYFE